MTGGRLLGVTTFPGSPEEVRNARRYVRRLLDGSDVAGDAELLASEVITNAIVHTASGRGGTVSLAVVGEADAVRVEVMDDGGAPTTPHLCPDPHADRGRGLHLVEAIAASWGVCRDPAGTTTWFELERAR